MTSFFHTTSIISFFIFVSFFSPVQPCDSYEGDYLDGIAVPIEGVRNVWVNITTGSLRGATRKGVLKEEFLFKEVDWFLGIPYAKPPVGSLRFKKTEPVGKWKGIRDALMYGSSCLMRHTRNLARLNHNMKEDCLYLNVFTPLTSLLEKENIDSDKHHNLIRAKHNPVYLLPVMLFIHGGSYEFGSGSLYVGDTLAQFGVLVVTINYRLGVLGFLSANSKHLKGNFGLHDQLQSLKWVRENIAFFGGDPSRVTIFGNSAGASSVGILSLSPLAKGLFKHAIIQSGSPLAYWSYYRKHDADLKERFRQIASFANCTGSSSSGVGSIAGVSSSGSGNSGGGISGNSGGFGSSSGGFGNHSSSGGFGNHSSIGGFGNHSSSGGFGSSNGMNDDKSSVIDDDDEDIRQTVECLRSLQDEVFFLTDFHQEGIPAIKPTKDDDIPCIDGEVIKDALEETFRHGNFHVDKLMIGMVSHEWTRHIGTFTQDYSSHLQFSENNTHDEDEYTKKELKILRCNTEHDITPSDNTAYIELFSNTLKYVLQEKLGYSESLTTLAHHTYFSPIPHDHTVARDMYMKFVSDISFLAPSVNYAKLVEDYSPKSQVYFYLYDHFYKNSNETWYNNFHSIELNYIFGGPFIGYETKYGLLLNYDEVDKEASFYIMKIWSNFAKTGDPKRDSKSTNIKLAWQPFNSQTLNYASIDGPDSSYVAQNLRQTYMYFWTKLAPLLHDLEHKCDQSDSKEDRDDSKNCFKNGLGRYGVIYMVVIVSLLMLVAALCIALCSVCWRSKIPNQI